MATRYMDEYIGCIERSLNTLTIPRDVGTIRSFFYGNTSGGYYVFDLTSVTFPTNAGIVAIGEGAFAGTKLTTITIPEQVSTIESYAFYCCTKLTSIVIPKGVNTLGLRAFAECTGLTSVIFKGTPSTFGYGRDDVFYGCDNPNLNIYVPWSETDYIYNFYEISDTATIHYNYNT